MGDLRGLAIETFDIVTLVHPEGSGVDEGGVVLVSSYNLVVAQEVCVFWELTDSPERVTA